MLQKSFFSVAVSRIVRNAKSNKFSFKKFDKPDAYDVCIKAKAIARTAGAEQALSFSLNQRLIKSSQPVLINTVLTALSAEGNSEKFWQVVRSKVEGKSEESWSPELVATLLNQISKEMQLKKNEKENESSMQRATNIYIEALEKLKDPTHLHIHNAYLKCISRFPDTSYLLWIINKMTQGRWFHDIDTASFGVKEYLPVSESSLKLAKLFTSPHLLNNKKIVFDSQSLTSILSALSRSATQNNNKNNNSGCSLIQLAESIWLKFKEQKVQLDSPCYMALLLVYRNDLSRIFNTRKLIRSTSWRQRKLNRVLEIIKESGADLTNDPKTLSIYFEICLNVKLKEKIAEFMNENPRIRTHGDGRLLNLISRNGNGLLHKK